MFYIIILIFMPSVYDIFILVQRNFITKTVFLIEKTKAYQLGFTKRNGDYLYY